MMTPTIRTHAFRCRLGRVWLAATDEGLCAVSLGTRTDERVLRRIAALAGLRVVRDPEALTGAVREFEEYFEGRRRRFDVALDLRGTSGFQRRIWEIVSGIGYGSLRSYKWVAEAYGGSDYAHAVGSALRTNPFPIVVPCHRVINDDLTLGGYTAGRRWKERLIGLESGQLVLAFADEVRE
jgi:methylated-DNA-[protein]-cysteine S-methyltransferase